ncbi:cbb3-type cytochrome oxidase assembly protein CcoS [Flagellimonas onchidii]|uniref:cbb3-type cytochrome oxidase assembly protein CcoS n=1 Tax=Flagellimonas onchidii TaxID=2562684 RepID=UPI0010A66BED|nr:cbb3-type cytochrome oxidase assembly protein CcoS [Allomuricauda onchidii]
MSVIYVLLAISISVAIVFFAAFVLSVKNGQYDDAYTPSVRMLFEDELLPDVDSGISENKEIEQPKSTNQ